MAARGLLPPAETTLVVVCAGLWLVAGLTALGLLPLAGFFPLALYPFFSFATVCGWLAGNVYVRRRHRRDEIRYPKLLPLIYLVAPPSLLFLLRMMAPLATQRAAPLVPLLALGIYWIFFLVPVTLRQSGGSGWRDAR